MTIIRDSVFGACLRYIFSPRAFSQPDQEKQVLESESSGQASPVDSDGTKAADLCVWYDADDPENPLNWPTLKKLFIVIGIASYAFVVYMSAPIWTPSEQQFMDEFGTGYEYTALGLALFVYARLSAS